MKQRRVFSLILLLFIIPNAAIAADHFIRAGATGSNDGSNWADAWTDLPSVLVRGDTYYVADGTYSPYVFDDSQSGSTYIVIKKATGADHGTDVGWNPSFGDGLAEWTTGAPGTDLWVFTSGYYIFDGQVGGGPGSWDGGFGFKVSTTYTADTPGRLVLATGGADFIEFHHIDFASSGAGINSCSDGLYAVDSTDGGSDNWLIDHCYIHDVGRVHILMNYTNNWTIEYTKFAFRNTTHPSGCHGESISANFNGIANNVIRYSMFQDVAGTGYVVLKSDNQSNWEIYGNIFYETQSWSRTSNGTITDTSHPDSISNSRFNNNTFANLKGNTGIQILDGSGNEAYNNLFYSCPGGPVINSATTTHDYSWVFNSMIFGESNVQNGTGDPFVDMANANFHLSSPTFHGLPLGLPYETDGDGNTRGLDGIWDRGAFEFGGTPLPPGRRDIDLRIRDFKSGSRTEQEVKDTIREYMESP